MKNNFILRIYPKKVVDKIDAKVKMLGNTNYEVANFLIIRLLIVIVIFVSAFVFLDHGYVLAPIFAILIYISLEKIVLDLKILKRGKKLEKEAIYFLEILILSLEGGRNLRHALQVTVDNVDLEISEEFRKTLAEVKLGKSLNEAFNAMKKRIPSDMINNAIINMISSNTFGSNIIDSMYNQIQYLREAEMLDIKAEIAKLPTKVSVISVLFFVPIMLLIILAPVLVNYVCK